MDPTIGQKKSLNLTLTNMVQVRSALEWLSHDYLELALLWLSGLRRHRNNKEDWPKKWWLTNLCLKLLCWEIVCMINSWYTYRLSPLCFFPFRWSNRYFRIRSFVKYYYKCQFKIPFERKRPFDVYKGKTFMKEPTDMMVFW